MFGRTEAIVIRASLQRAHVIGSDFLSRDPFVRPPQEIVPEQTKQVESRHFFPGFFPKVFTGQDGGNEVPQPAR